VVATPSAVRWARRAGTLSVRKPPETGTPTSAGGLARRACLKLALPALIGLASGGCALKAGGPRPAVRRRIQLAPIDVSWDRIIRTSVGLRPHRRSGFVVKADRLDDKTVIHNYGHGGTGLSLSWGTASLAADLALAHEARRAAILGCGVVGLTAAREFQRRGFEVTIYAMATPPETCSNAALGGFTPTAGLIDGEPTPEFEAQFRRAAEIAYYRLQLLVGPHYGVSWIDSYTATDVVPDAAAATRRAASGALLPDQLRMARVVLGPGEHPFPTRYAVCRPYLRIEPSIYLDALVRDVLLAGARIVIRKFDGARDLMTLDERLIVNCTGLGSRALFGDQELVPVKGQLTFLLPQPEVTYQASGRGASALPRRDGIALGFTAERDVWTLEPNAEARRQIMDACIRFFGAMRRPDPGARVAAGTVFSGASPAVESFFDLTS
jgi:D-amino-acid oxidase